MCWHEQRHLDHYNASQWPSHTITTSPANWNTLNFIKTLLKHDTTLVNIIAIVGSIFGIWGYLETFHQAGADYNILNSAYSTLRLFAFESAAPDSTSSLIWQLEVGRWSIVLFMFYYAGKGIMLKEQGAGR